MKTNKFEETIREKLEGVHSEFADGDWSSFQKFYKANTPAGFWKSYGSWLGYGSAAALFIALSGVCGLLYQQNAMLKKQVREMKEMVSNQPAVTIDSSHATAGFSEGRSEPGKASDEYFKIKDLTVRSGPLVAEVPEQKAGMPDSPDTAFEKRPGTGLDAEAEEMMKTHADTKTYLKELHPPGLLAERTPAVRIKIPVIRFAEKQKQVGNSTKNTVQESYDAEKAGKESRTLPTFVTNRPYRIGLSGSLTKDFYSYGAVNEFSVFPGISVTWGISRTVYKEMVFFNEKVFFEQTKQSFHKAFGKGVPLNGDIMNISTQSSLIQVPVFVNYRRALGAGFYLTGSVGTNLNIRFRQSLGYDFWDGHKQIGISGLTYRRSTYPMINNFSPVLGVEKVFDPIVFQAEAFYHFQNGDIPYRNSVSGAGGRFKLLYQFGK